ncbi:cytochrome P450 18a1 isoform X1 [Parasteatoda tepidariorum]|uniref:cytochrome P450 18a1 isoform X1 n=1 Tax=Parasteatoda tepidariorum TaxID=114398 RepID=UPI001C71C675|nr:cytochrome P450 18a1 isoform X2 [Parasteatoda tepidariorum]
MFLECLSIPLVSSTLVLLFTYTLVKWWRKNRNLPPGPNGLPLVGYYPFLSEKPYLDFASFAKKFGTDVISLRTTGGKLIVVLNSSKLIKDIFVNRSEEFIGRPIDSNFLEWLSNGLGITQEEGSNWKEHRRFFLQAAKSFGFGKVEIESTIHEEIRTLIDDLRKTKGESARFDFHISYVISTMISKVMFDKKFEKYGDVFPKLAQGVVDLIDMMADHRFFFIGSMFRYVAMRLMPWSAKVREGRQFLKKTVQNLIEEHIRTFDPKNLRDYVDSYLYEIEKLKKNGQLEKSTFNGERLLAVSMNMLMEGSGPSGILGLLLEAAKHPEEQKLVQKEIDSVVGRDRLPSWLDRNDLAYTEAFIQELHRCGQSFYISNLYSNFEETKINGFRIPKRSTVIANLWTINNDPEIYPEPEKFDVNRFLGDDGKRIKTDGPYPFGIGKRECAGQALASMEIFLIISSLMQYFTLLPGNEEGTLRAIPRAF